MGETKFPEKIRVSYDGEPTRAHIRVYDGEGRYIGNDAQMEDTCDEIVRRYNVHTAMLKALREALNCRYLSECEGCTSRMKAAIQKAEGK